MSEKHDRYRELEDIIGELDSRLYIAQDEVIKIEEKLAPLQAEFDELESTLEWGEDDG